MDNMKVLYIGNYRDGTGWGNAAINNILALDTAGIEVVPRAISFQEKCTDYPERIKLLEQNNELGCDVCIQHTLPHLYCASSHIKNIGFIECETDNFKDSNWQNYSNTMEEIWVAAMSARVS